MSGADDGLRRLVAELRRDFDRGFTTLPQSGHDDTIAILKLDLGGQRYGIRLHEMQSVDRLGPLQPLPGVGGTFLGLAGSRGTIVAVYDLAALLGLGPVSRPRWLLVCPGSYRIGLAVVDVEGCAMVGVPGTASNSRAGTGNDRGREETIAIDGVRYRMIDLRGLVARIGAEAQATISERARIK